MLDIDLPNLVEIFAEWITDGSDWKWSPVLITERGSSAAASESLPHRQAVSNADVRSERLERCRVALDLRESGLTRKGIAESMGVGFETVKSLLRDGSYYLDPTTDSVRTLLAAAAHEAKVAGVTKAEFGASHDLSAGKTLEAWRDGDVLYGRTAGDIFPAATPRVPIRDTRRPS